MSESTDWYLLNPEDQKTGPLSSSDVRKMLDDGTIDPSTPCWHSGMEDWEEVSSIQEFSKRRKHHRAPSLNKTHVAWALCGGSISIVCLGLASWWMRSAPMREARAHIDAGQYAAAGRIVMPIVQEHPDQWEARYLLGLAAVGDSVLGKGDGEFEFDQVLASRQLQSAVDHIRSAANQSSACRMQVTDDLRSVADRIAPSADDALSRWCLLSQVRERAGTDDTELALEVLDQIRQLAEQGLPQKIPSQVAAQLLAWEPSAATGLLSITSVNGSQPDGSVETLLRPYLEHCTRQPQQADAVARAVLDLAESCQTRGHWRLADSALRESLKISSSVSDEARRRQMDFIQRQLAQGDHSGVPERIEQALRQWPAQESAAIDLLVELAWLLRQTDIPTATQAFEAAMRLDPKLSDTERGGALWLMLRTRPSEERWERIGMFIETFPGSEIREHVLRIAIAEAEALASSPSSRTVDGTAQHLLLAQSAAEELVKSHGADPRLASSIVQLASGMSTIANRSQTDLAEDLLKGAISLSENVLQANPKVAEQNSIRRRLEAWQGQLQRFGQSRKQFDAIELLRDTKPSKTQLDEFADVLDSESQTEVKARVLAVLSLGTLIGGDSTSYSQYRQQLNSRYPDSALIGRTRPDQFYEDCPECDRGNLHRDCAVCSGTGSSLCANCRGSGTKHWALKGESEPCVICGGDGRRTCSTCNGKRQSTLRCSKCAGRGVLFSMALVRQTYNTMLNEIAGLVRNTSPHSTTDASGREQASTPHLATPTSAGLPGASASGYGSNGQLGFRDAPSATRRTATQSIHRPSTIESETAAGQQRRARPPGR